jgi:CBS-domain-containing membrane protein
MKVSNLMSGDAQGCNQGESLASAAMIMWNHDCGIVPVLDGDGRVTGMISDRDICMAVSTQGRPASDIRVGDVMSNVIYSVSPDDDIYDAIGLMRERQIRRLPVVDQEGRLQGILSVGDIVRNADKGKSKRHVSNKEAMRLLKAVSQPRHIVLHEQPETSSQSAGDSGNPVAGL